MDRFVSRYVYPIDAKGRASIPAAFRQILATEGFSTLYTHPALDGPAVDCGGKRLLQAIESLTSAYPVYSQQRDLMALALEGDSEDIRFDKEGRFVVTERMRAVTGVLDQIAFVGLGYKFQIWEPTRLDAFSAEARAQIARLRAGAPS
jgi:MraZ protein